MPTGYTSRITKEMPLEAFVWICARAFGALITMRDDSLDVPIPQRLEPSAYHRDRIVEARARLAEVTAWTDDQAIESQKSYLVAETRRREESDRKDAETKEAYERMLALVDGWTPPTSEHCELKKFMHQQITESIRFDCGDYKREPIAILTTEAWKAKQIAVAAADLEYHAKGWADELKRTADRNDWIDSLRSSLTR